MRLILALIISFQFVSAPIAAELGEARPFSVKEHLLNSLAKSQAADFELTTRQVLADVSKQGLKAVTDNKALLNRGDVKPVFKEKTRGHWEYTADDNKISFTLADLSLGQMKINDQILVYKNLQISEVEKKAEKMLTLKKTSMIRTIFNNTFGIQDAQACELVCGAVILIVAVAIIGLAVNEMIFKPQKMVKRLNEMKAKLDKDAVACTEAKTDQANYQKTFTLANSISDRSAISSATSPSDALEYALKTQLESGRKNEDCYQIMNEIGKKIKINIPVPTSRQITMRELNGSGAAAKDTDMASAAFNLCSSYNQLGSCMENFVASHVNDSDINTFKDVATPNHYRYQKSSGAGRQ